MAAAGRMSDPTNRPAGARRVSSITDRQRARLLDRVAELPFTEQVEVETVWAVTLLLLRTGMADTALVPTASGPMPLSRMRAGLERELDERAAERTSHEED